MVSKSKPNFNTELASTKAVIPIQLFASIERSHGIYEQTVSLTPKWLSKELRQNIPVALEKFKLNCMVPNKLKS